MSGGTRCKCEQSKKPLKERGWIVLQRNGNASAFNGGRWQYSSYSCLSCPACRASWRTTAAYVRELPDGAYR